MCIAILILGPSGSGKSKVSEWLAEDLDLLHFEADPWPVEDGIDRNNLRKEWDLFYNEHQPKPLYDTLMIRSGFKMKKGVILSLPSMVTINPNLMRSALQERIYSFVLYGRGAECIESFLDREKQRRTFLGVDHWIVNNSFSYVVMSRPEYKSQRILTFNNGQRKSRIEIIEEISYRLHSH